MRGVPEAILVAPGSFTGTFTAREVASAVARGLEDGGRTADRCPLADGGAGTMDALGAARGAEPVAVAVHDPLGRALEATFMLAGADAFVDTAAAGGSHLVAEAERDPVAASTYGIGELIAAAVAAGARTIHLGAGGSAAADGGAGAIRALRDAGGLDGARLVVLCDVRTPFQDAARVFGPEQGAGPADVRRLTRRLGDQARSLARAAGRDPRGRELTGAAGGLAGGLWAAFGAELVPGAGFVLDAVHFDARMRAARCVITGAPRLDARSLVGTLVSEVATRARQGGVPCHVVCGARKLDAMGARVLDLERVCEAATLEELRAAGSALAAVI